MDNTTAIDLYRKYKLLQQTRLAEQKKVELLKEQESAAKAALIAEIGHNRGFIDNDRAVKTVGKQRPFIGDYDALRRYVIDNGSLHLFNRALNAKAVLDEIEDLHSMIPGVEMYNYYDLSDKKA